jgi:hypothetical protein
MWCDVSDPDNGIERKSVDHVRKIDFDIFKRLDCQSFWIAFVRKARFQFFQRTRDWLKRNNSLLLFSSWNSDLYHSDTFSIKTTDGKRLPHSENKRRQADKSPWRHIHLQSYVKHGKNARHSFNIKSQIIKYPFFFVENVGLPFLWNYINSSQFQIIHSLSQFILFLSRVSKHLSRYPIAFWELIQSTSTVVLNAVCELPLNLIQHSPQTFLDLHRRVTERSLMGHVTWQPSMHPLP